MPNLYPSPPTQPRPERQVAPTIARDASSATTRKMRHKISDFPRNQQKPKDIENAQKFAASPEHASQAAATALALSPMPQANHPGASGLETSAPYRRPLLTASKPECTPPVAHLPQPPARCVTKLPIFPVTGRNKKTSKTHRNSLPSLNMRHKPPPPHPSALHRPRISRSPHQENPCYNPMTDSSCVI